VGTQKVFLRRRPMAPMVLALTTAVVAASLGVTAGPAVAGTHRYRGAAPGQVTCRLVGTVSFSPKASKSDVAPSSSHLRGRLSHCAASNPGVSISSGRVTEQFSASPLNCATLSGTGARATLSVSWKGALFGLKAAYSDTTEATSRSQVVTNANGDEGFAIPGGGGFALTAGSFASSSGSAASVYTTMTRSVLAVVCGRQQGVRRMSVAGTITVGSPSNQGGGGGGASAIPLGDYAGTDDPQDLVGFGAATGTDPTYAVDYLDKTDGWSAMDDASIAQGWKGTGYRLVLGIPILPGTGTLAEGATGAYNGYFATLARNLVSDGEANAILRLGWEFNGSWYPWYVADATDAANFVRFWQQIVTTMRAATGQQFKFLWNASADTGTSYTPAQAYPGNAYVDYVGTDVYDEFWGSPFTPAASWSSELTQQWGLNWLASFAAAHGKPIAIPEWSVSVRDDGHGLGDDPSFIDNMAAWFVAHQVAFDCIFSFDISGSNRYDITDGTFPASLAAFRAAFG